LCDAQVSDGAKRRRSTIAPAVRRKVLDRDGHRCRMAGCGSRRNLRLHHRIPLALGGTDRPENLLTLCDSCHTWVHRKLISDLTTSWTNDFTLLDGVKPQRLGCVRAWAAYRSPLSVPLSLAVAVGFGPIAFSSSRRGSVEGDPGTAASGVRESAGPLQGKLAARVRSTPTSSASSGRTSPRPCRP
jgi:hypothetical protein